MHLRNSKWFVVLLKADLCRAQAQGTERNLSLSFHNKQKQEHLQYNTRQGHHTFSYIFTLFIQHTAAFNVCAFTWLIMLIFTEKHTQKNNVS